MIVIKVGSVPPEFALTSERKALAMPWPHQDQVLALPLPPHHGHSPTSIRYRCWSYCKSDVCSTHSEWYNNKHMPHIAIQDADSVATLQR